MLLRIAARAVRFELCWLAVGEGGVGVGLLFVCEWNVWGGGSGGEGGREGGRELVVGK